MEENEENVVVEPKVEEQKGLDREEAIKNWIGEKADIMYPKMQTKYSFNVFAFLFSVCYFAYRKMYLVALLAYLVLCLAAKIGTEAQIICWIIAGFAFYPLYKWDINRKLDNYEAEERSEGEIKEFVRQNGGTSVKAVIVCLIPIILLLVILFSATALLVASSSGI